MLIFDFNVTIVFKVGKEFCGHDSETLQESLQKQCLTYFQTYHIARLDELKTHLENEGWTLCPVKLSFSPRSLTEFGHMKLSLKSPSKSPSKRSSISSSSEAGGSYFVRYWSDGNPFEEGLKDLNGEEDILLFDVTCSDDGSSEEEEHLVKPPTPEDASQDGKSSNHWVSPPPKQGFCLANTTLMVLRQFGRYIHLMKLLHPISSDILIGIKQLFQFYLYSVCRVFSSSQSQSYSWISSAMPINLIEFFDSIERDVVLKSQVVTEVDAEGNSVNREVLTGLVRAPSTSLGILSDHLTSKYKGLLEKIVAVESCVYLSNQLVSLIPHIKECLENASLADTYFSDQLSVVHSLRDYLYLSSINNLIGLDTVLAAISKIKWDIKEVRSQHSEYVDALIQRFNEFSLKFDQLSGIVPIESDVKNKIWSIAFQSAAYLFVEGFSNAKKCTNEGRALMQLDYRQFVLKTEKLTDMRPIPCQDFVTTYIKAFYIPESELEVWVGAHQEYSATQLTALVNAVAYSNNKARQKLNNIVNDLQSKIRR